MTAAGAARLVRSVPELVKDRSELTGRVAVVMTMGALHAGHADLLRAARGRADQVVATIFVNPLQFGPAEDLDRYPRTLEADLEVCRAEGVDLVFAPAPGDMYPESDAGVRIDPGPLATILEGAHRPGHFGGVLTVVLKLLQLTQADVALFGEKDYQQLTLIRAMVADLNVPVDIVGVPTRREPDGLALSSRNRYLSADQRQSGLRLSRALHAGRDAAAAGRGADAVLAAGRVELDVPDVRTDYLALTSPNLGPAPERGPARLLVAATVGSTRLIDNIAVELA